MSLWENCGSSAGLLRFLLKLSGIGNVADGISPEWCVHNTATHTHTHSASHSCSNKCKCAFMETFSHNSSSVDVDASIREKYTVCRRRIWAIVNLICYEISHHYFLLISSSSKCKTALVHTSAASTVFDACLHGINVVVCCVFLSSACKPNSP